MPSSHKLTQPRVAWSDGDQAAPDQLPPPAKGVLHWLRPDHIQQTTALINEADLRLIDWEKAHQRTRVEERRA